MRIKRLDILRCLAVLLILVHHAGFIPIFTKIGWVGVDLFFVLSGFLISGLLYSEFKRLGTIRWGRFLIRRGLKIYPAFYVMILVTFLARQIIGSPHTLGPYLREIFFIQNYGPGVWQHTWSLGVEEHFYLLLPIFFPLLIQFSNNQKDPFASLPWAFAFVAVSCFLFRAATVYFTSSAVFISPMVTNPTHERMDSLFFGVLLGYFHHFHAATIANFFESTANRIYTGLLVAAALSCCFVFTRENHFLLTFGLTLLYLGFGGLLLMSLQIRDVLPLRLRGHMERLGTLCAAIGTYSYSIYLWHIPFQAFAPGVLRRLLHIRFGPLEQFLFYLAGSIVFGILMARAIEFPVLKLRDRLFPQSKAPHNELRPEPQMASTSILPSGGP